MVATELRLRRALAELVNASDGLVVAASEGSNSGVAVAATVGANVALVVVGSVADRTGLTRIRVLADQMPVVAVSAAASVGNAALAAGATTFCEMDGNTDAMIAALVAAGEMVSDESANRPACK